MITYQSHNVNTVNLDDFNQEYIILQLETCMAEPEWMTGVDETQKAIDCEDHGQRSKQTMTVIVAVYLPDSPLHIVSILCYAMYANS